LTGLTGEFMKLKSVLTFAAAVVMTGLAVVAHAESLQTRHVFSVVAQGKAQMLGPVPASQIMQLDVMLPVSDRTGLDAFVAKVSDPTSTSYRKYLTPQQFSALYGPSKQDYDATVRYLESYGLTVVGGSQLAMDVQVKGPASAIEAAFNVQLNNYQHPTEDRTFYSPDREPTTNLPFALWHISGLDNFSIPQPMLLNRNDVAKAKGITPEEVTKHATTGSGPEDSFLGSDMRAAYYGSTVQTGAGQNLGLFEFVGTDLQDLATYYHNVHQTNTVPIYLYSTDGTPVQCIYTRYDHFCDDTEQTIDMTQALGVAPGLNSLTMYIGSTDSAIIGAMTTYDPLPLTISCSWGWSPVDESTLDPLFERMAVQGQSFFTASGDSANWAYSSFVWPADDAYVTSVGGTDLVTTGPGGAWESESAWEYSGGGLAVDGIDIPAYQSDYGIYVINGSNGGSTVYRNGPDVSANANFTYYVCADLSACTANLYGGTSFAAPLWAGYMALSNEYSASVSFPSAGFINPVIYGDNADSIESVTDWYSTTFHDITTGGQYDGFSAVSGYDLVTGWGSPNDFWLFADWAPLI
jgi:subtilase family serine protease